MDKTFNNGDRVTVTFPPNYYRKTELECSGEIRGLIKGTDDEYVVKLDGGQIVYPKIALIERSLL